jgi:protein gp37
VPVRDLHGKPFDEGTKTKLIIYRSYIRAWLQVFLHAEAFRRKPLQFFDFFCGPRRIFVNSMSDLFHPDVPLWFINRVFKTMVECPQHSFQILTKRSGRLEKLSAKLPWPANVWMGVSVEDSRVLWRADDLRKVPAAIRFLSCEPLIGSLVGIDLTGIHWVIVGGESGFGARPMKIEWVREIFRACRSADVPFFFKQWGGVRKDLTGRLLRGRTYDEMPQAA